MEKQQIKYLIGLSFGKATANFYLTQIVKEIIKNYPLTCPILQTEIARYFKEPIGLACYEIAEHRQGGKYLDSIEVLEQANKICQENKKVIIVAHPDHLPRCLLIARTLGLEPVEGRVPYKDFPYDPKDPQWQCRSRFRFMVWELFSYLKFWVQLKLKLNPFFW